MTFWYLASPYSKYPRGIEAAHRLACEETGRLIRAGVPAYSPIAHSHPIAAACGMDPYDHRIWMPAGCPMMRAAFGLIMLSAEGWEESYGMNLERETFEADGKPIIWMDPGILPSEFRS